MIKTKQVRKKFNSNLNARRNTREFGSAEKSNIDDINKKGS